MVREGRERNYGLHVTDEEVGSEMLTNLPRGLVAKTPATHRQLTSPSLVPHCSSHKDLTLSDKAGCDPAATSLTSSCSALGHAVSFHASFPMGPSTLLDPL